MFRFYFFVAYLFTFTFAQASVNTSGGFNLNVGAYGNGTQNVAVGKRTNKDGNNFSIALPSTDCKKEVKPASFRCNSGLSLSGLVCSGFQTTSSQRTCHKNASPSVSMAWCDEPEFNYSTCQWKAVCGAQYGGNVYKDGDWKTTCPSGYELSNSRCERRTIQSAIPYCSSGWSLSGYSCFKN